jgi:hypothetical protein
MNDTELFPPTTEERLAAVRTHLQEEVEKRDKAATAAMQKLYEARELLETFDMAMKAQAGGIPPSAARSATTESFTDEVAGELDAAGVEYERGEGAP